MKEALWYKKLRNNIVQCQLCPQYCVIKENERGICKVRLNQKGKLYSLVYGKPSAINVDPIEKKPLFHFYPGSLTYSIGTAGCNLSCLNCQNWELSQSLPEQIKHYNLQPKDVVKNAIKENCKSVAYTYNEPTVYYEYMYDSAKLAKTKGLKNVFVTNAYINPEPLQKLCKVIDAASVDLKGFDKRFYKKICGAKLDPVLNTLKIMKANKVWIEIVNLIIPGYNDNLDLIEKMCDWIKTNLGQETVLHFSKFFPMNKMLNIRPTEEKTLLKAKAVAEKAGLKFVYVGNIMKKSNTYCPKCKELLIARSLFSVTLNIKNGRCCKCGYKLNGRFP